jgi:hypothetical protein
MPAPLNFDDWFKNYQATANSDAGQQTFLGPNQQAHDAYNIYAQGQYPLGDPRSLPPGFMQSGYGPAYQSVLDQWNARSPGDTEDSSGLNAWLRNAPQQFSAGRSLQDWLKPTDNSGISGAIGTIGMMGAGALSGGLTNAGIAAINSQGMSPSSVPYNPPPVRPGGLGGSMPTQSQYGIEPWMMGGSGGTTGNPPGLFDNLLGTVGNLSPAILAGYLGNSQRQDVMGQVGRLNDVAGSLSGPAFMQSITNPYDLQTGQGRTALSQSLQQRGVGGSSFGNQQLGNYDYQRGLGRGDLATRAGTAVAGTQGQLYSNALHGMVGANAAYNNLLGAGLGASGSLFNRGGGNPLAGLIGGISGGLGGLGGSLGSLFGNGTDPTTNPYAGNPGGQVDFGNDPSLGIPDSTSGNGLFDWLGQNGGDISLGGF